MDKIIFLFEDEEYLREGMEEELIHLNFKVKSFESVKHFNESCHIQDLKNHILLTDQSMPDSPSGVDFIKSIKDDLGEDAPFCILVSGYLTENAKGHGGKSEPDFYMEKPLDYDVLYKVLSPLKTK